MISQALKTYIFPFLSVLVISLDCNAQTEKGAKMLGGHASARFNDGFGVNLNPNLGYFVTDDFAVGSGISLGYSNWGENRYRSVSEGLHPFVRYYFGQPANTRVFAHARGGMIWYQAKGGFPDDPNKKHNYTQSFLAGGLGLVHFITEQVGLEALLMYGTGQIASGLRNGSFSINFGIQVHLPRSSNK